MRIMFSSICLVLAAGAVQAQGVDLTEAPLPDSHVRIELTLDLQGTITLKQESKDAHFSQTARAKHEYHERLLEVRDGLGLKAGRLYSLGEVTLGVEGESTRRQLNPNHALVLLLRKRLDEKPRPLSQSPFTREELELTEHFDTLAVPGLVPGKTVQVGDQWQVAKHVVQALCGFDALGKHDLTCSLKEVKGDFAQVKMIGSAQGIDVGAQVNLLIEGSWSFDLKNRRLVSLVWKQTEERGASPVNPKIKATVAIALKRTPSEPVAKLNNFALVPLPDGAKPEHYRLTYNDPQGRFSFQHGRDWLVTSPPGHSQLVMRLLDDRGGYVAQATITPLKKRGPAEAEKSVDAFAEEMAEAPGWNPTKEIERKGDLGHPHKYTVHRVSASGQHLGVECIQSFVYITRPEGDQVLVTFSMPPNQAANLNGRDEDIVRTLAFSTKP